MGRRGGCNSDSRTETLQKVLAEVEKATAAAARERESQGVAKEASAEWCARAAAAACTRYPAP